MATKSEAKWRRWLNILRATHPCEYPVKVYRQDMTKLGAFADTLLVKGKAGLFFRIRVEKRLPLPIAWIFLIHEWAHAMTWDVPIPDHSDAWGISYAELWREHLGDGDYESPDP